MHENFQELLVFKYHKQNRENQNRLGDISNKYDNEIISFIEKAFTQLTLLLIIIVAMHRGCTLIWHPFGAQRDICFPRNT